MGNFESADGWRAEFQKSRSWGRIGIIVQEGHDDVETAINSIARARNTSLDSNGLWP